MFSPEFPIEATKSDEKVTPMRLVRVWNGWGYGRTRGLEWLGLSPERPFIGVSGPSIPKIAKKASHKESFWGFAKSPRKHPKMSQKNAPKNWQTPRRLFLRLFCLCDFGPRDFCKRSLGLQGSGYRIAFVFFSGGERSFSIPIKHKRRKFAAFSTRKSRARKPRPWANGVVCKSGRTDLTGFCLFSPVGVRLAPLKTHDFEGFQPDFNRTLTRL